MSKEQLGVNPWLGMWFNPRKTISSIVQYNPKYRFGILSFIYGLPMLLQMAQNLSLGETYGIATIVIAAVILATFIGMLAITIASGLLLWTGKWIGGQATYYPIRAAVSWSNVPNVVSIIVWAVMIYVFRTQGFTEAFESMQFSGSQMAIASGGLVIQGVLSIWSFIMLVKGLGEVQGFSAWKGVLNVLIPFFLIGIVVWAISWLFWMTMGFMGM